ncbi:MAG: tetratricopeptide repeat protein [Candidatus Solibacter sp.]|jgi:tetratricopeptide (TPR) repeat protein
MVFWAGVVLAIVAALLYQARGVFAVILAESKTRAGDYEGALRRLRWASLGIPNSVALHKQGLVLALAGRPAEAELCYRKALGLLHSASAYPRQRLLAALGYALIDLARYDEAEQCFEEAIDAGDRTGNSQDGLAESRVVRGVEADKALAFTTQAIEHAKGHADGRIPGSYYALQAWALALLGRTDEAGEALAQAERVPEPNPRASASLHWRAGMALLAMRQTEEARRHFRLAYDLDPHGKYGSRCRQHLG